MVKKVYYKPTILPLQPEDDPTIPIGGSQGTIGDIDMFSFADDITPDIMLQIQLYADDIDFADMDADNDLVITKQEFMNWVNENDPWWWEG